MFRIVPNLFHFDLGHIFRDLCEHLVNDVSRPGLEPMAANGNNHPKEKEFIYHNDVSEVDATPVKISSQAWLVKMANWIELSIKLTSQYDW